MNITHEKSGPIRGSFRAEKDGKRAGEMFYSKAGQDKIIIDHTEVEEAFRGEGVGKQILYKIVEWARAENIKIVPLCPFAKSVFDKEDEIRDVLN
ncbi:GNAT family N-acetyltransferase [Marivirga atlantica]|jgi:predicted GNAT family acetyltransferase|uniref:N-acetyltransferase n=1 Tax=Marivirga atlantica TaxID=1548457 RepID=A0A937AGM1_9BACT|nr:GNAT family N-acetyltransferase [Marivirga atlantica]MBL0766109.1 N-acetyltransferase [Marivirga atlantica]